MPVSQRLITTITIALFGLSGLLPTAANASQHEPAAKKCVAGEASTKPSRYNRTPKGAGPWHVPVDPCNTEAAGASMTPYFNCAYWAAEKRPDIWVNAVLRYGYSAARPGAWRIEVDAKRAKFPIDHKPQAGDVAAWGRGATMGTTPAGVTYTASLGGHVAYVEKVRNKHKIVISTMGVDSSDGGKTITLAFSKQTSFIHQL